MDSGIGSMILLITGILVATLAVGVIISTSNTVSSSLVEMSESKSDRLETDIQIISDTSAGSIYDYGEVTLLIKNTGSTESSKNEVNLQIDGEYVQVGSVAVLDGSEWKEDNVVRITATKSLSTNQEHIFQVEVNTKTDSIRTVVSNG